MADCGGKKAPTFVVDARHPEVCVDPRNVTRLEGMHSTNELTLLSECCPGLEGPTCAYCSHSANPEDAYNAETGLMGPTESRSDCASLMALALCCCVVEAKLYSGSVQEVRALLPITVGPVRVCGGYNGRN